GVEEQQTAIKAARPSQWTYLCTLDGCDGMYCRPYISRRSKNCSCNKALLAYKESSNLDLLLCYLEE
ncbi:hypothetical protein, partial [Salmonella sp. S103_04178]|uniref:hypothetical protein n=1 Tax=Salmonella sp. S103_04178 TaxID=2665595 RepID=UPI001CA8F9D2